MNLRTLPLGASRERCYMQELANCEGPISGEHLISKALMQVLRGDGDFTISGLPWLDVGVEKKVGLNSLTAKCLCRRHNAALSPLDSVAALFVSALRECLEMPGTPDSYLFSGHDVERWLLKTLKAMAVSGNLGRGCVKSAGIFRSDIDIIERLDDHRSWPAGAGLYLAMPEQSRLINDARLRICPWMNRQEEIVGLWTCIAGLQFIMMIADPATLAQDVRHWLYRPGALKVAVGPSHRLIEFSWDDGLRHSPMTLTFEKSVTGEILSKSLPVGET